MIRYVGDLIAASRRQTDNERFSATEGLSQEELLQYMNDAQDFLQAEISNRYVNLFDTDYEVSIVANQEAYALPANAYSSGKIAYVEYSETGQVRDYLKVELMSPQKRYSSPCAGIYGYWIRGNSLMLIPPQQAAVGKLRITYEKDLDNLDLRRGKVESMVYNGSVLERIVLAEDDILDETALGNDHWFCFSDRDGLVKDYNVEGTYDSALNSIAVSLTAPSLAIGDYVTVGKYSATHCPLPRNCERFFIEYCSQAMMDRDNVKLSPAANARIQTIVSSLLETFSSNNHDSRRFGDVDYWMG